MPVVRDDLLRSTAYGIRDPRRTHVHLGRGCRSRTAHPRRPAVPALVAPRPEDRAPRLGELLRLPFGPARVAGIPRRDRAQGLTVVTVALDVEPAHTYKWIDAAAPTHPAVIDTRHVTGELFGFVNIPMAVWIDEAGMLVRPAESACVERSPLRDMEIPEGLDERLDPHTRRSKGNPRPRRGLSGGDHRLGRERRRLTLRPEPRRGRHPLACRSVTTRPAPRRASSSGSICARRSITTRRSGGGERRTASTRATGRTNDRPGRSSLRRRRRRRERSPPRTERRLRRQLARRCRRSGGGAAYGTEPVL